MIYLVAAAGYWGAGASPSEALINAARQYAAPERATLYSFADGAAPRVNEHGQLCAKSAPVAERVLQLTARDRDAINRLRDLDGKLAHKPAPVEP